MNDNKYPRPHYPEIIACDFCGRSTRGVIRSIDPDSVRCTSCDRELTKVSNSVVVNGEWPKDHLKPSHTTSEYNQTELFD